MITSVSSRGIHRWRTIVRFIILPAVCVGFPGGNSATASTQAPTLKLFPTTVLEDIKQTAKVAKEMESGLQDVIAQLDQQAQLFRDSKCEGALDDPGCNEISRQMGDTYLRMLMTMDERLPTMEDAVNATKQSLKSRLRKELGEKMTPWDLQTMLLEGKRQFQNAARPALRGNSGMRLSDRFGQYYQLVANAGYRGNSSLAVMAADIYLDMAEASDLIARTRDEIARATLMGKLNQSFGAITPEMQEVVAGVKAILFGEEVSNQRPYGPPVKPEEGTYISPLQL